jgi:hypothetical protein
MTTTRNALSPILFILCLVSSFVCAKESEDPLQPSPLGNFSLPTSQQPGPLVSFGYNILDKGQLQLFVLANAFIGKHTYETNIVPSILYGIRDDLSFFFNVPFSPGNKDLNQHSSGLEDIFAQFEYAFLMKQNSRSTDQATLVVNGSFPTGSSTKVPPTGFGSYGFFIGTTFYHMDINWFAFASPGVTLPVARHETKFGNQILYQCGFGIYIPSPRGWIFNWLVEFDGIYFWKNKINNLVDPNSGGNVIYITPSIWISSKRIILQFGSGYPAVQHLFGDQPKQFMTLYFNLGITLW